MKIDSHLHLPPIKRGRNFLNSKKKLFHDMEKNKIDYAILIPDNVPNSKIGDLDKCLKLIEDEKRLFLMGTLNILKDEKSITNKLELLFEKRKIVAVKIFPGHDKHYPTDKRLFSIYKLCVKYSFPIVIHTGWNSKDPEAAKYNDPKYIVKIAKKFKKLKIVVSHYFWPKLEYCYELTKNFKNIYYDTSALADNEIIEATGLEKIKEILIETINKKPNNVLFGTDYSMCDIKNHIDLVNSLDISEKQKDRVFYKNAIKLFKLKLK